MCKEPIQRKEERQRFYIRHVAAESAAFFSRVLFFLLVAMISILAVLILPAIVLVSMCL
jgi:flagellar biogenesis protein FliO